MDAFVRREIENDHCYTKAGKGPRCGNGRFLSTVVRGFHPSGWVSTVKSRNRDSRELAKLTSLLA